MSLSGKTLFITGASRGIGRAIALRAARDGANIVIAAKTAEPHPKLPGTIHSAAEEVRAAGGTALPLILDVRDAQSIGEAVTAAVAHFGGIDICINNASAVARSGTIATEAKRYDLMHEINSRGTFFVTQACLPYLRMASNPHVLALSPPLDLRPHWFAMHPAYTASKYTMSLYMMAMAEEFRSEGIAFNALWPRTTIATSAVKYQFTGDRGLAHARQPEIVADAAYAILNRPARQCSGQLLIDDDVLWAEGVTDFSRYAVDPTQPLHADLFIDPRGPVPPGVRLIDIDE